MIGDLLSLIKMLNPYYNTLIFGLVTNLTEFYTTASELPEVTKVRQVVDASRLLFKLPMPRVKLYVAQGVNVYTIELYPPTGTIKFPFAWIIYIPKEKRLDICSVEDPELPVLQWKNKKLVFANCSDLFKFAQIDKLFQNLVLSM